MGASQFVEYSSGKTPDDAFWSVVNEALYENGHGGYSGTIAEKDSFRLFERPEGVSAKDVMEWGFDCDNDVRSELEPELKKLADQIFEVADDKWGPAAGVEADDQEHMPDGYKKYIFFGWASC